MKFTQYALIGMLLCTLGLSAVDLAAVDPSTFDTVIELHKKQQATRKDVINAYGQLQDKQLGDQLLQVFLQTNISTLRTKEARKAPQYGAVPASVNRGRPECAGRGCGARRHTRASAPRRRMHRRSRVSQERRDLQLAKRRSLETAAQALEKEELETAKAISAVEAAQQDTDLETAQVLSLVEAAQQEERDLQEAIKRSLEDAELEAAKAASLAEQEERNLQEAIRRSKELPAKTKPAPKKTAPTAKPVKDEDLAQRTWTESQRKKAVAQPTPTQATPTQAPKKQTAPKKPQAKPVPKKQLSKEDQDLAQRTWAKSQRKPETSELPSEEPVVVEEAEEKEPVVEPVVEKKKAPEHISGVEVTIQRDGTAQFDTFIEQFSHKEEELFFWALKKNSNQMLDLWSYDLSRKTKNDTARWKALTPLVETYNKPEAPKQKLGRIMRDTIDALEDKASAEYQALPQELK